jgi:putative SOS response-associated peptidase YedK
MCGRFTLAAQRLEGLETTLAGELSVPLPALPRRYNIAPTQRVALVRAASMGRCELAFARWGLIPSWSESPRLSYSTFNARTETVADKPAFRSAFRQRRCLIPADGWYEWERRDDRKLPWYFRARHSGAFAFAGLWERWERDGETLESCAIIVTRANAMAAAVHERMPVVLPRARYRDWLAPAFPDREALLDLLVPCPDDWIVRQRVGPGVNSARRDDRGLIEPVAEAADA